MAELRKLTARFAIIEIRLPRDAYDRLTTYYASQGRGLEALRLALPDLVTVLLERRQSEIERSAQARERSDRAAARFGS